MAMKFALIGSGLAGGLLAAYLGRRVYDVEMRGREDFVETNPFASRADVENSPSNFQEAPLVQ
jgi:prephenate dehydrogenase